MSWEDPLEEGMATHSRVLAWRIPGTEEPGGLQSAGLQGVRQDWVIKPPTHSNTPHPLGTWIYVHLTGFTQTKKIEKKEKALSCHVLPEFKCVGSHTYFQNYLWYGSMRHFPSVIYRWLHVLSNVMVASYIYSFMKWSDSHSVMANSLQPHRL